MVNNPSFISFFLSTFTVLGLLLKESELDQIHLFQYTYWDILNYEWSLWALDRGFWHIEIFCIN